ncbi:MAG: hypothetical protein HG453_004875 [Clostridiales bacterium]|nr:hypothetical protein [Clostridiales bacterium]
MIQTLNKDNVTLIDIQNKISEIQDYLAESKNSIIDQVVDLSLANYKLQDNYYKKNISSDYNVDTISVNSISGNINIDENKVMIGGNILVGNSYNNKELMIAGGNSYRWNILSYNDSAINLNNANELLLVLRQDTNVFTSFILNEDGRYSINGIDFEILDDMLFIDHSNLVAIYYR